MADATERPEVVLKFRNYVPRSKDLRQYCCTRRTVEDLERRLEDDMRNTIEKSLTQDALAHVNPKKPNWDLKRDTLKKLAQLQRRTDNAILQLIRMNVAGSDSKAATTFAVSAAATAAARNKHVDSVDSDFDDEDEASAHAE